MFRSDTQRIHAQVVKGRALRDRTHVELVGEPVCVLLSPRSVVTLDGKYAISALRDYTGPVTTTPNGVPITVCATCHREHPQGKRHCGCCGRPSAFISDDGRCLAPACREAKA